MPTTVNGIGTHYYGTKNAQNRAGVCRACGTAATLQSYDTRLWFVILYIPVIPLGRKRIIDQCSRCKRHWVLPKHQWEAQKQLSVSSAMDQYRAQPSAEAALALHGQFLGFQMMEEAEKFRQGVLPVYAENPLLLAGLAEQMEHMSQFSDATPLFEQALALQPDMPQARLGVARRRLVEGRLDEAHELLSFLENPGSSQTYSLGPLEQLAHAYQGAGRHDETLNICQYLLSEVPAAGNLHAFRKFVTTSEKALVRTASILPPREFSWRGLFDAKSGRNPPWQRWAASTAIIMITIAAAALGVNEYKRRHRSVFVVGEFREPIRVSIDGKPARLVTARSKQTVTEGRHHLVISGAVEEEFDIDLHTGYFERWTKDPVWVVNVGGASAFIFATIHYAAQPRPADMQVAIAEDFLYFPHVDYAFENPPDSLTVENRSTEITKTHLSRATEPAKVLFAYALSAGDRSAAFRFAESNLKQNPEDGDLLNYYALRALDGDVERAAAFLKGGLWHRPISVVWHRAYQDLLREVDARAAMAAEYDAEIEKDPRNASLLYLRGRVSDEHDEEVGFFKRAMDADPTLPWPHLALAYDAANRADWPESRSLIERAYELKLRDPSLQQLRHVVRLATGDTAPLEAEYRQQIATQPLLEVAIDLCDILAAQGRSKDAWQVLSELQVKMASTFEQAQTTQIFRQLIQYMLGEFAEVERAGGPSLDQTQREMRFHTLLATGHPAEAVADPLIAKWLEDPFDALAASVAFHVSGQETDADVWRRTALAKLEQQGSDWRRAAALLQRDEPPSQKELDAVVLHPRQKALFAVAVAAKFPENRGELHELARKLNVSRLPPYQLVRKVTE